MDGLTAAQNRHLFNKASHGVLPKRVGLEHMPGVQAALQQQQQQLLLQDMAVLASNHLGTPPEEGAQSAGIRRALVTAALRLCCSEEVLAEYDRVMGPLPAAQQRAWEVTTEIYGSTRMLLAVLPPQELAAVCSGWRCDMWQVLAPLRAVRPVNGGSGADEELAIDLQMLYVEVNSQQCG